MDTFHIYIFFPRELDRHVVDAQQAKSFVRNLQIILDRADCEKGSLLKYEGSNKNKFVEEIKVIGELTEYSGIFDLEETIDYLLLNADAKNWEDNPLHDVNEQFLFYKEWIAANRNVSEQVPPCLKEITEKALQIKDAAHEKVLLLNIFNIFPAAANPVVMLKGARVGKPEIVEVDFITNFEELDIWFFKNRTDRIFNFNDNRHIENHPSQIKTKSPLLGGLGGKQYAAELLKNAVGDQRARSYLVNYDKNKNCFIRFEDEEHPQNIYHGYHLVKPISHENDFVAEKDIPERIIQILKYRGDLN